MNISEYDLLHETARFIAYYPWVWDVERQYGLPRGLLLAVGSRETNLTNEVGDGGHGHGVWQLDDRSHTIPPGFDSDVEQQAVAAAEMLRTELAANGGSVDKAADVYNSGRNYDAATTGGNYGTDVAERLATIQKFYPEPTPFKEIEIMILIRSDAGAVAVYNGATKQWVPDTETLSALVNKLGQPVQVSNDWYSAVPDTVPNTPANRG